MYGNSEVSSSQSCTTARSWEDDWPPIYLLLCGYMSRLKDAGRSHVPAKVVS